MDPAELATELTNRLRGLSRPDRAAGEKAYLKSDLEHLGCSVPVIRRTTESFLAELEPLDGEQTLALAEALWDIPIHERRMAAVEVLVGNRGQLEMGDIPRIERLLRECRGWALLDGLIAHLGLRFEEIGDVTPILDRWAADDDFWMRRAALLADLIPLREGRGDFDRFTGYADGMLAEKDFFIRKAIGWVLRDASRLRPGMVAAWVLPRAHRMSGVTVREAVKRLPDDIREEAMTRYAAR